MAITYRDLLEAELNFLRAKDDREKDPEGYRKAKKHFHELRSACRVARDHPELVKE